MKVALLSALALAGISATGCCSSCGSCGWGGGSAPAPTYAQSYAPSAQGQNPMQAQTPAQTYAR